MSLILGFIAAAYAIVGGTLLLDALMAPRFISQAPLLGLLMLSFAVLFMFASWLANALGRVLPPPEPAPPQPDRIDRLIARGRGLR